MPSNTEKIVEKSTKKTSGGKAYTFGSSTYKAKPEHPRLYNIDQNPNLPKGTNYKYNIVEIPKGTSFCITFKKGKEDFEVNFKDGEDVRNTEDYLTLEANINAKDMPLYKPFRMLAGFLGNKQVDFTVFVEYITYRNQKRKYFKNKEDAKLIVSDIYINTNWIRHKDLIPLCNACNLEVMPVLYEGVYDPKIIDVYANKVASGLNKNVKNYGVVVKFIFEDEEKSKRLVEEKINNDFKKFLQSSKEKESRDSIEEMVSSYFPEQKRITIDSNVEVKFPGFRTSEKYNKGDILSHAVKITKLYYFSLVGNFKEVSDEVNKEIEKDLNKALSSIFMKRYNFYNKGSV